jgi:hypothetical protein
MTTLRSLQDHALAASRYGESKSARVVLRHLADRRGWCDETFRARWDGGAALLSWWHTLEPVSRPPLADLNTDDARSFLDHLEGQGLARSTLRGYRVGAAALTSALRACREHPVVFDAAYVPFKGAFVTPPKPSPVSASDVDMGCVTSPLAHARLELLLALMALGLSLPAVCSRLWMDVNLPRRLLVGYKGRTVVLGAEAVAALEALLELRPKLHGGQRVLGWQPATARRWLKEVRGDT